MISDNQKAAAEIQASLDGAVSNGIPGISAAVATRDGVVWTGSAGVADIATGEPIGPETLFGIGSITKMFIAVVILQLIEEGRLRFDDTPEGILDRETLGIPNGDRATVAQLLNHTSGIPSWEHQRAWILDGRGEALDVRRIWGKAETLDYVRGHAPLSEPGEAYSYANTNYTLLGLIIEKVTGAEATDEIRRRILIPLDLNNIFLEGFEPVPRGCLPHRYHWATPDFRCTAGVNQAFPELRPDLIDVSASNLSVEWAAGGMLTTADSLVRFGTALRDSQLLTAPSMAFLTEWRTSGGATRIGHSLFREELPSGHVLTGHTGGVLGFSANLYWIDGSDAVAAAMCNIGAMHSGETATSLHSIVMSSDFIAAALKLAAQ